MSNKAHHCVAECQDCGEQWQDYQTARKEAREHAKRTGHYVAGEYAVAFSYHFPKKCEPFWSEP